MSDTDQRRGLEIILVLGVWFVLFSAVAGPVVDAALPGSQESMFADDDDMAAYNDLTVRGLVAVVTGAPVLAVYVYLRQRRADRGSDGTSGSG